MTATQIVDILVEAAPLDAGQFMSDFPIRRTQYGDFNRVVAKLLKLKAENDGEWSDTGDINVTVFGGDQLEKFRSEHATHDHFQSIIDFDAAVVDTNGDVIQQGIAQENPLDTFYGWRAYLDLTNEGPMKFWVTFGKNDGESGSFESGLPPEVEETVRAHFSKFKEQFIDKVMWLEEARGKTRAQGQKELADVSESVQVAEARQTESAKWEQIGGDFGDAWAYGGTWVNKENGDLLHFPGIEGESKETDASSPAVDKRLTAQDYKNIIRELHLDDTDKWENAEDEIRSNHASAIDSARKFTYYRTCSEKDETIEKDWAREIAEIKQETEQSDEDWVKLPPAVKLASIADRIGWHEFDHYPEKITRNELGVLLDIDL